MFAIIKTENKVKTDFSFVYSASIKKKHRTTERTNSRLCTLAQTHKIVMALECLCERVYRFIFFSFLFSFHNQFFFLLFIVSVREMFVKVIWQQKLCHCSFIGLHLVRALTHAYGGALRPMSFFSARRECCAHKTTARQQTPCVDTNCHFFMFWANDCLLALTFSPNYTRWLARTLLHGVKCE